MALSLDATICSPTANSYVDLSTAGDYFEADSEIGEQWAALDQDSQTKLLITASRFIDRQAWAGDRLSTARFGAYGLKQALAFPRSSHPYRAGTVADGGLDFVIDSGLIDQAHWPDRFFVGGAALASSGANRGALRQILGFYSDSGKLTIDPFDQAMIAGDGYCLIYPHDEAVVLACLDQAAFLYSGGVDGLAELADGGLTGATVDGLSLKLGPGPARDLGSKAWRRLRDYRPAGPRLERG